MSNLLPITCISLPHPRTPLLIQTLTPQNAYHHDTLHKFNHPAVGSGGSYSRLQRKKWVLLSNDQSVVEAPTSSEITPDFLECGSTVVRRFYEGINGRDLGSVEKLIAENCVYEDLIFPQPFVGRKAILEFFNKFIDSISSDLRFVIDDISEDDPSGVGVTWHLEWKGKTFPFSKGCSFYRLEVINGQRLIRYGRDSVEPAFKPGELALGAIRGVTWILQQFPQLADRL